VGITITVGVQKLFKIPSTKTSPQHILEFLSRIKKNEGNIEEMKKDIHNYLLDHSKRISLNEENTFYAIAIPALNRLELTTGRGDDIRLSSDGKMLVNTAQQKGHDKYLKALGKIILKIDDQKAFVIKSLENSKITMISLENLVKILKKMDVDTTEKDTRLLNWLSFLNYVGIIKFKKKQIKFF